MASAIRAEVLIPARAGQRPRPGRSRQPARCRPGLYGSPGGPPVRSRRRRAVRCR